MRNLFVFLLVVMMAATSFAEMDRTLYTRESRFPTIYRPELNVTYDYTEMDNNDSMMSDNNIDLTSYTLMGRIQILEGLTVNADLPYNKYSSDIDEDHNGIGDVTVGASLLAYEYILDYPFVIPHIDHTFDTGDEDKNLGAGESYTTAGVTVGTITHDVLHWLADVAYQIRDKSDNALVIGGSLVWELSDKFSVLGETQYAQVPDHSPQEDSYAMRYTGGMTFKANDYLSLAAYGTESTKNTQDDFSITLRATISL